MRLIFVFDYCVASADINNITYLYAVYPYFKLESIFFVFIIIATYRNSNTIKAN